MTSFGLFISIFGLGLLILVHELGHFLVGKALKLKITVFFSGLPFGKSLVSVKRGETAYGVKPFLFGGYVKFPEFIGLYDPEVERVRPQSPAALAGLKKGDRVAALDGVKIENWLQVHDYIFSRPNQTVRLAVLRQGLEETLVVRLGERAGGGWLGAGPAATDDITIQDPPMTLGGQKIWRKALVIIAGPAMNIMLAAVLIAG